MHIHTMGMFLLSCHDHKSGATTEQLNCVMAAGLIRSEVPLTESFAFPPESESDARNPG